ncbi:predicted protein [Pyrenophora tritici-repentis Pt-1C-BFP]|uniref:Uncharacterized protein n=1 Tax=Pyrenophora tritici-repentis (strain Pt-1C-BFP) TaxID=426418 RepID=B2VXS5_PYRTR|nr:uncharacterized protein PTRG_03321 [Pyrenophora tritici-repentis Pt-1C-BFP]EDU45844.1 predicted protein [Pyrenophora tritici-repentis Pt-1C-BFP]
MHLDLFTHVGRKVRCPIPEMELAIIVAASLRWVHGLIVQMEILYDHALRGHPSITICLICVSRQEVEKEDGGVFVVLGTLALSGLLSYLVVYTCMRIHSIIKDVIDPKSAESGGAMEIRRGTPTRQSVRVNEGFECDWWKSWRVAVQARGCCERTEITGVVDEIYVVRLSGTCREKVFTSVFALVAVVV